MKINKKINEAVFFQKDKVDEVSIRQAIRAFKWHCVMGVRREWRKTKRKMAELN